MGCCSRNKSCTSCASLEKNRSYQPVFEIAEKIAAYLGVFYVDDVLVKISDDEVKNTQYDQRQLKGKILMKRQGKRDFNVLLVDDLYSTGRTLTECVRLLQQDMHIKKVYVLTMTKTREVS